MTDSEIVLGLPQYEIIAIERALGDIVPHCEGSRLKKQRLVPEVGPA